MRGSWGGDPLVATCMENTQVELEDLLLVDLEGLIIGALCDNHKLWINSRFEEEVTTSAR